MFSLGNMFEDLFDNTTSVVKIMAWRHPSADPVHWCIYASPETSQRIYELTIQISWKNKKTKKQKKHTALEQQIIIRSGHTFAHAMTAKLS